MALGIIQFFFILIVTCYEYRRKSPVVFMWATLLVMFGIMHVISYAFPEYKYADTLDEASLFVILFCVIYIMVRIVLTSFIKQKKVVQKDYHSTEDKMIALGKIVLFISVVIYAYCVIGTSGSLLNVTKDNVYRTMAERFLLSSARMDMVILFVGFIAYVIFRAKKRGLRNIMILGILGIFALLAIYSLRTFRYYYSFSETGNINMLEFFNYMLDFVKNDD